MVSINSQGLISSLKSYIVEIIYEKVILRRWINRYRVLFIYLALVLFAAVVSYPWLNRLLWHWDEGNILYTSFAWTKGLIPNIDFINGYPGLLAYLLKIIFMFIGSELYLIRIFSFLFSLVTASSLFYISCKLLNIPFAALAFLSSFYVNYLASPLPNPGNAMSASISLGVVLLFLFVKRKENAVLTGMEIGVKYYLIIFAAAFFIGLSISFKQAGLFGVLGLLMFMVLSLKKTKNLNIVKYIFFSMLVIMPFLIFLTVRVPNNLQNNPYNVFIIIPWVFAIIIGFQTLYSGSSKNISLSIEFMTIVSIFLLLGSAVWLLLYPVQLHDIMNVVRQVYITVPSLIDKLNYNASIDRFLATIIILVIIILLLITGKQLNKKYKMLVWMSMTILVVVYTAFFKISLLRISPLLYESYLTPALLSIVGGFVIIRHREMFSYSEIIIIIIGFIFIASGFPYPKNTRYASFGVLACYLPGLVFLKRKYAFFKGTREVVAVFCFLLISTMIGMIAVSYFPDKYGREYYRFHNTNITISIDQIALLRTADWLKRNTDTEETIGGYSNFALVFYLIEKTSYDGFPNFIGNESDYKSIVSKLAQGNGPDYFLISPTLYPYKEKKKMHFMGTEGIIAVIDKHYRKIKVINDVEGNGVIYIYKKNII